MKISIIGANSYIARNLIHFINNKDSNIELDIYDYQDEHIDNIVGYKKINVLDKNSIQNINFKADIIYVFTGKTGTLNGFEDYENYIDINEKGLLNILSEYKKQESTGKIIFPSSRLVYKGAGKPLEENDEKEFKTIYAINKYSCEQYLSMFSKMYNIPYAIFRICVPYGTMIKNASSYGTAEFMLKKAQNKEDVTLYGNGSPRRTLTNIKDLCEVLFKGALSNKCLNDVYNIGGENYSLNEMAGLITKKYGVGIKYIPWPEESLKIESGDTVFNSSKLDKIISHSYSNTFAEWVEEIG